MAPKLTESMKQQVIVESRPGANGIVGTEAAARAAPDGYTIVLIPSAHAVNATLYKKLPYRFDQGLHADHARRLEPAGQLAAHPSLPAKNVKELIAFAKARPGQLTYGFLPESALPGTSPAPCSTT